MRSDNCLAVSWNPAKLEELNRSSNFIFPKGRLTHETLPILIQDNVISRRLFLILALLLTPPFAFAQSLAGTYDVWGRNIDGAPYDGTAEVRDDGETVTIFWDTTAGIYSGTGVRVGSVVLIEWGADHPVVYTIMDDGELHGTWADGYALDRLSPR